MERIAHTRNALLRVADNWSHTHGTNEDGDVICIPCMAALLADIHTMIFKDAALTPSGKVIIK